MVRHRLGSQLEFLGASPQSIPVMLICWGVRGLLAVVSSSLAGAIWLCFSVPGQEVRADAAVPLNMLQLPILGGRGQSFCLT